MVDTIEEAQKKLTDIIAGSKQKVEHIMIRDALDRIIGEDIYCIEAVPGFRRSTVDGYAVIAKDTQGASENMPAFMYVKEEVFMGEAAKAVITSGQCAYVPTGGMIPEGADAVVMIEYCEAFDKENIVIYDAVSVGRNVVGVGEDMQAQSKVLSKGSRIRPQEIGVLAAIGHETVCVYQQMTVTIISTGDELVDVKTPLTPGKVHDINTYALEAQAKKNGFRVNQTCVCKDQELVLKKTVLEAMQESDIVLISGGSSQGKKDVTEKIIDEVGSPGVFVHGLALKPGKPTICGYDRITNTILIGLPGHPVAAMMVFELLSTWIDELKSDIKKTQQKAQITMNIASAPGRSTFQLVALSEKQEGLKATPILGKSGLITTLTKADGYTLIDRNKEGLKEGEMVNIQLF